MTFGEHVRKLREQKQLLLREVASQMHIDTALLSKIERGTRTARKEQVEALAIALNENKNELLNVWMADKIVDMIKDENNSEEILKIAKENRFDLILLDIQLPGFDGLEVLKEIKKIPEIRRTPVIALTVHAMQGDEDRFLKAGCSGYISQPIDIGRFKSILDTCTGGCQVL